MFLVAVGIAFYVYIEYRSRTLVRDSATNHEKSE